MNNTKIHVTGQTATEVDNYGFYLERQKRENSCQKSGWEKIGFVVGSGNSTSPIEDSVGDKSTATGKYFYRLKPIDVDGIYKYSKVAEAIAGVPNKFNLSQIYSNTFNPTTTINFALPKAGNNSLKIFNIFEMEVAELVDDQLKGGNYSLTFYAS